MAGHNGYFKVGDCIEIAGTKAGIVTKADDTVFWMNTIIQSTFTDLIISADQIAYSNEAAYYEDKYWVRKTTAPTDYKFMDVSPLA